MISGRNSQSRCRFWFAGSRLSSSSHPICSICRDRSIKRSMSFWCAEVYKKEALSSVRLSGSLSESLPLRLDCPLLSLNRFASDMMFDSALSDPDLFRLLLEHDYCCYYFIFLRNREFWAKRALSDESIFMGWSLEMITFESSLMIEGLRTEAWCKSLLALTLLDCWTSSSNDLRINSLLF